MFKWRLNLVWLKNGRHNPIRSVGVLPMEVELDARRGPLETEVAGELLAGVSEQVLVELWRGRKACRA